MEKSVQLQRDYYERTAIDYNAMHYDDNFYNGHNFALSILSAMIEGLNITSILDLGSGTGRALLYLKKKHPTLKVVGIEPVKGLREQGYQSGLLESELIEGNGLATGFEANSFDIVCEFGVLHHVPHPEKMVAEMLRVAKRGIFISDNNNFGMGSKPGKLLKQTIHALGLWRVYDFIRTKGKMYQYSEGDGIYYSYSVFNNYKQISKACSRVYLMNTEGSGIEPYRSAKHVALLGLK